MNAKLLNGKEIAADIRAQVARDAARLKAEKGITPGLAVVLVGEDPASVVYVGMKERACEAAGMRSIQRHLPATTTQQEILDIIAALNHDPEVHGILVQVPMPKHIDEDTIFNAIAPAKDVDGVTNFSFGRLVSGKPGFAACTAAGIIELIDRTGIPIEGKNATIVGRSKIVGKPVALLLLNRHATVTVCHTRTRDLAAETQRADILVAAVGKPEIITGDMIGPGAVVIDAGYNRVEGRSHDVGDVHFDSAAEKASWITPVPGGVGPMTIAILMRNTVTAAALSE